MHLLAAQAGAIQQEGEAIDLGQTPGAIVFASSADSELMLLAGAADRAGYDDLRLANFLRLSHNLSVDLWLDKTVRYTGLVVVRLLGGPAYWQYGVDQLTALASAGTFRLALLPGDAVPDPILRDRSTIANEDWDRLHALFVAGGPDNADTLLGLFRTLPESATPTPTPPLKGEGGGRTSTPLMPPASPKQVRGLPSPLRGGVGGGGREAIDDLEVQPFPRFGYWRPERGVTTDFPSGTNNVPILFYRAALEGAGTATLEALIAEVTRQGMTPVPILVSTLKEAACVRFVQRAFADHSPASILNLTGFALGLDGLEDKLNPFFGTDAPVIQLIQGGRPEAAWTADIQGLTAKDLAMQVVLPELDGRIGGILVGHKAEQVWHPRTQCPLSAYAPNADGIRRAVGLAANWARLRAAPRAERKIAIVLANYPIRDGRIANGVGYDAPESTVRILELLEEAGYRLTPTPSPSPQGGGGRARHRHSGNIERARRLRNGATIPERVLWPILKQFRIEGYHFRRQVPIGPYYADFACHHPRLVVELDGDTHGTDAAERYDAKRTAFLNAAGYHVLRVTNSDVATSPDGVWQAVSDVLARLPSPLMRGGVGGGGQRLPKMGNDLIDLLQSGPSNAHPEREGGIPFPLARYRELFAALPEKIQLEVTARWGDPAQDPFVRSGLPSPPGSRLTRPGASLLRGGAGGGGHEAGDREPAFHLPALRFDNVAVLLQPARGYHLDETASYHDPDLVPPHGYLAAYLWLRHEFGAHAVIHNGKHGNLEWLPGKAVALDAASYPAALLAEVPHLYPFIVNDPGEGTQAKRRTGAVIVDHLVPPLTRAETYGPLKDLEALLDEYYAASGMDRRRLRDLRKRILSFTRDARLDRDIDLGDNETEALKRIDTFLCDLKEAQIRDGLHIFGQSPEGRQERDLIVAIARVPRGERPEDASLIRALADDLKLGFDPLTAELGEDWTGPRIPEFKTTPTPHPSPQGGGEPGQNRDSDHAAPPSGELGGGPLPLEGRGGGGGQQARTIGDVVEHLEHLAAALVEGTRTPEPAWLATRTVLDTITTTIRPRLAACGSNEVKALLDGLDGKFIPPGPSGAPSRGRLDVLPTGRNFYSVDIRAVPTPTAWELGRRSAENVLLRHFQDHGVYPKALALSVWGTANMRTGGDDIAQALAFIGARPAWDPSSLRLSGYEVIPLAKLGRPRVDVTLRISGFFRDAFPAQITLFDRAVRAIGALDEPEEDNPIAARMRNDALGLMKRGESEEAAALSAGYRIFGSKPGAYGAGLQALIDSGSWQTKGDLATAFLNWGQYAYGAKAAGRPARDRFAARLSDIDAVVHNQDNREHDLLDSDDYYQFEGGLVATAESLTGTRPAAYHNDHSRPERPRTRTLAEEVSHVVRSRVVNPKWIDGVKRHGYKGAFEIIATVDYMFAFAATTGAVQSHHFDLAFDSFVKDEATRQFLKANNRFGYDELLAKFAEARDRGYWTPRSNSAYARLGEVAAQPSPEHTSGGRS